MRVILYNSEYNDCLNISNITDQRSATESWLRAGWNSEPIRNARSQRDFGIGVCLVVLAEQTVCKYERISVSTAIGRKSYSIARTLIKRNTDCSYLTVGKYIVRKQAWSIFDKTMKITFGHKRLQVPGEYWTSLGPESPDIIDRSIN